MSFKPKTLATLIVNNKEWTIEESDIQCIGHPDTNGEPAHLVAIEESARRIVLPKGDRDLHNLGYAIDWVVNGMRKNPS